MYGLVIGIIGLALCAIFCGIGSSFGLKFAGSAAVGVMSEDPSKFSKVIVLALLPATQGIYGFVIALMGTGYLPAVASATATEAELAALVAQGWSVFAAVMPMTVSGIFSAILQGQTSAITIQGVGKRGEISGRALLLPAMIEFYAILGLVVSILLLGNVA